MTPEEILELPGRARIAWAVFDPAWYCARHPDVGPEAARARYLGQGAAAGASPNAFFDEGFYRARHADVRAAIAAGAVASGFEHYCREGHATRAPHWLFDESFYRAAHADLTGAVLAAHGFANGYDHYLKHGAAEGRIGHPLFDPAAYRAGLDPEARAEADRIEPFRHLLDAIDRDADVARASPYFDPACYAARYPEALAPPWRAPIEHYLGNDTPTRFDPLAAFSEDFYLARYPDVARAVAAGALRNGYWHFLVHGRREGRTPHPAIDLAWYVDAHETVRADLAAGRAPDPFTHYLRIGAPAGLAARPPPDEPVREGQGRSLFRARARNLLPLRARRPLDFTCAVPPAVSVVMVLHDQFALTMLALASLRAAYGGAIELVLVDSGSRDATRRIGDFVHGAKLLRLDGNIGFVRGCNAGLLSVTAPFVLFLNSDIEIAPGALEAALGRIGGDPAIGAVGAKIIRAHGVLQEAGCIIWRNGETEGYMRDASPLAPEANFVRDVDYCSAAFLLVRADLLIRLGGLAEDYSPAYYEDADLCVRIAEAGFRVVYDPAVVVCHLEHGSATSRAAAEAAIARGRSVFEARHGGWLARKPEPREPLRARACGGQRTILLIEDMLPLRVLGSGFVRSNDIVAALAGLGWHVTVFPLRDAGFDLASVFAAFPDAVEVMHDRTSDDLAGFLAERAGYYDTIWLARTHNLARLRPALEALPEPRPRLVLDTEALASMREAARPGAVLDPHAALDPGAALDPDAALRAEFAGVAICDRVVAVSAAEAALVRSLGVPDVHVLGHVREPAPAAAPWSEREGMLFVGAIHEPDSPNRDALDWFADEVLPIVERALGWRTRLTVAGYTGDGVDLGRLAAHPRITLRGPVSDLAPLYAAHRMFVAPTRFAAGLPYKVHEAASFGLPVVATELLAAQLGWRDGIELLAAPAADPAAFAAKVLALHGSRLLWKRLRDAALARIAREHGRAGFIAALEGVLERDARPPGRSGCAAPALASQRLHE